MVFGGFIGFGGIMNVIEDVMREMEDMVYSFFYVRIYFWIFIM